MAIGEFDLINRYFDRPSHQCAITRLGIGDDCALLSVPEGQHLAVTTDTMVENIHFFPDADPFCLGHKILAVNLSDLAAMGAKPVAVSLALTLPKPDPDWLEAFAQGFWQLADRYQIDLIGGDTTAGPLSITVQAMGLINEKMALRRSNAKPGDAIYITGTIGDACLALKMIEGNYQGESDAVLSRLHQPLPRVAEGLSLLGIASACVDISDGLTSDLGHILKKSGVGATLTWDALAFSSSVRNYVRITGDWKMPLIGGEDYELCFTVPLSKQSILNGLMEQMDCTKIGVIDQVPGLRIIKDNQVTSFEMQGYQHFL